MLQLLIAKAHERLECDLIAEPMIATDFQDFGVDEALHEAEDVGITATLHLAHEAPLLGRQKWQLIHEREAVGKKLLRWLELASADDVSFDVPADSIGCFDAARVALRIERDGWRVVRPGGRGDGRLHGRLLNAVFTLRT